MKTVSYLFECEVAGTKRFLNLPVATLLGRLDGGSKSVQHAFERKLFHIGPSDFPRFLFRFNGGDLFLIYSTFTKNYLFLSCFITRYNFHCDDVIDLSSGCLFVAVLSSFFHSLARSLALVRSMCLLSCCRKNMFNKCQFLFLFYCYSFSFRESFSFWVIHYGFYASQPSLPSNIFNIIVVWLGICICGMM